MFLAEIDNTSMGTLVQGISALATIALTCVLLFRTAGGKDGERQIEPTALHALTQEMGQQTTMLNNINREVGEVRASMAPLATDVAGLHQRVSGISRELSATTARVDGLERREVGGK